MTIRNKFDDYAKRLLICTKTQAKSWALSNQIRTSFVPKIKI